MKTVFVDIDTQFDFLVPSGALYIPRAEHRISAIARLNRYAVEHGITLISTVDAHAEDDPEFTAWPPHCIAGTLGQHKPESTLVRGAVTWKRADRDLDIRKAPQIVLEKLTTDPFLCPNLKPVLAQLQADKYIVYGVATDVCVYHALSGFLRMGKKVEVVLDAIQEIDPAAARKLLDGFHAAGGGISTVLA